MLHQQLTQPDILAALARCGHGDVIAIVDCNYPALARRDHHVSLVNLNITHQVVETPFMINLLAQTIPIEGCAIPVPPEDAVSGKRRAVHEAIVQAVTASSADVAVEEIPPQDFYVRTSSPNLALMIVTGERSHYGSALLTVSYLPELPST